MELGTILIAGTPQPNKAGHLLHGPGTHRRPPLTGNYPVVFWDLLGKSVIQRTIDHLRAAGSQLAAVVVREESLEAGESPWEKVFLDYARNGVERIFLISLEAYCEFPVDDVVRFHRSSQSQVTNVLDEQGPLGISLVEAKCSDGNLGSFRNRIAALASCSSAYEFRGYSHRLAGPFDYRKLVEDALAGRCALKPIGREVRPGIWCGTGARISSSARILGPTYIGNRARVRAGAVIAPGTSVEQHSEVDCGTVIEKSSILPHTYLGPGLRVAQSIVSGSRLFHLGRNVDVELAQTGLLGRKGPSASIRVLESIGSLLGAFGAEPGSAVSTPSRTPASVDWVRSNGFFG